MVIQRTYRYILHVYFRITTSNIEKDEIYIYIEANHSNKFRNIIENLHFTRKKKLLEQI